MQSFERCWLRTGAPPLGAVLVPSASRLPVLGVVAVRTALFGAGLAGDHVATSCFCELTGLAEVRERRAHGRTSEPGGVGDLAGSHRSAVGKSRQDGGLCGA